MATTTLRARSCRPVAVVAVNAARPQNLLIVPAGSDLFEVKSLLGLDDGHRRKAADLG